MGKDLVLLHGANEGAWVFETFRQTFEALGFTCHAPDLIGHGRRAGNAAKTLVGVGMADYLSDLQAFLETVPPKPVLLGHSMGAILAQQLAAQGLAGALILVAPAPRSGILPPTDGEKQLAQDLMALGPFWKNVINPDFDLAKIYTLNRVPAAEQRAVFDKFGPESGLAFFRCSSGCSTGPAGPLSIPPRSNAPCYAWWGPRTGSCRHKPHERRPTVIQERVSGNSKATATCWCSSRAPRRSPAASPRGFLPKPRRTRAVRPRSQSA